MPGDFFTLYGEILNKTSAPATFIQARMKVYNTSGNVVDIVSKYPHIDMLYPQDRVCFVISYWYPADYSHIGFDTSYYEAGSRPNLPITDVSVTNSDVGLGVIRQTVK